MVSNERSLLTINSFSVLINGKQIVKDINLSVPERTVVAIIGPSGCGKSVLLKSIVGLLKQELKSPKALTYHGTVEHKGVNLLDLTEPQLEPIRKTIAYINQYPIPFPMSLRDNIAFGLKYWNPSASRSEVNDRIEVALKDVGLWKAVADRLQEDPKDLSAGELQKLCLARALVLDPEVLLLDEPCAYIDPISTILIEESLFSLKSKCSLVVVTHNMQQAARISDISSFFSMSSTGNIGILVETAGTEKIFTAPTEKLTEDYVTGRFG